MYVCGYMHMRWGHTCTWKPRGDVGSLEAGVNRHLGVARLVIHTGPQAQVCTTNFVTAKLSVHL